MATPVFLAVTPGANLWLVSTSHTGLLCDTLHLRGTFHIVFHLSATLVGLYSALTFSDRRLYFD